MPAHVRFQIPAEKRGIIAKAAFWAASGLVLVAYPVMSVAMIVFVSR